MQQTKVIHQCKDCPIPSGHRIEYAKGSIEVSPQWPFLVCDLPRPECKMAQKIIIDSAVDRFMNASGRGENAH